MTRRSANVWLDRVEDAREWELARHEGAPAPSQGALRHGHHRRGSEPAPKTRNALRQNLPGGLRPESLRALHALLPEVTLHLIDRQNVRADRALTELVGTVLGLPLGRDRGPVTDSTPNPAGPSSSRR